MVAAFAAAGLLTAGMTTAAQAATGPVTVTGALPAGIDLTDMSCASPGNCTATGTNLTGNSLEVRPGAARGHPAPRRGCGTPAVTMIATGMAATISRMVATIIATV